MAEPYKLPDPFDNVTSAHLAAVHPRGFGDLKWPSVPIGADWHAHIAKYIAPAVESAIERGKSQV